MSSLAVTGENPDFQLANVSQILASGLQDLHFFFVSKVEAAIDKWSDWFASTFQAKLNSKALTCLQLGSNIPEGLARIFETTNSTGMSLSVFDLLVSRLGTWENTIMKGSESITTTNNLRQ